MTKIYGVIAGMLAVAAAFVAVFLRGEKAGRQNVEIKQAKKNNEIQQKFNEIDAKRPDLDAAIDRLRNRAGAVKPGANSK